VRGNMSELKDLIRAVNVVRSKKKEFLVATLVRASESSTRRPGTRILLAEDRWIAGSVSGAFERQDLVQRALWLIRENAPVRITLDANRGDDLSWALGFGCSGDFEVLIERVGPNTTLDPLAFIERCVQAQLRGSVATICRSESRNAHIGARLMVTADGAGVSSGLPAALEQKLLEECRRAIASGQTGLHTYAEGGREVEVLVEAILPPPRLFLFGAGHVAAPIANLARTVGWDVYVCVRRARAETRSRFAPADATVVASAENIRTLIRASDHAIALVMTHDDQNDKDALSLLLRSSVRFVGLPGPRARTAKLLEQIGYDIDREPRIYAPIGVGMGVETWTRVGEADATGLLGRSPNTPQEVALAMIAEVRAAMSLPDLRVAVDAASFTGSDAEPISKPPPTSRRASVDYEPASGTPAG
jgi:xanthine dehydrogenase accessory factor